MKNEKLKTTNHEIEAIRKMTGFELSEYAKQKSEKILSLIQQSVEKIQDLKEKSDNIKEIKLGFFERMWHGSKRKTDALAEGQKLLAEAMAEQADLIRESIEYTCISSDFAHVMHQTMANLMAVGFRDVNGNIRKLDKEAQNFAQNILDAAESFVRKQKAYEEELSRQNEAINSVSKVAEDNRKRLDEKDDVDKKQEDAIESNRKSIDKNAECIHSNKTTARIAMIMSIVSAVISLISMTITLLSK